MAEDKAVSSAVVRRLPKYYRYLGMIQDKGIVRISSQNLSEITGFTASQIRQDLNHFGGFGQQGYGYNVNKLRDQLASIIGLDRKYKVAIVGAGRMGQAILNHEVFQQGIFEVCALFDVDPEKVGTDINGISVLGREDYKAFLSENHVDIIAITAPKEVAQNIAENAVASGVKGIWNYAPIDLKVPEGIVLENVHLAESLHSLIYYMGNIKDYKGA